MDFMSDTHHRPDMDEQRQDEQLRPLREQIDTLDAQILALLNQRAQVAHQVGEVKKEFNADRKSTRLNSSHIQKSRMPSSA